VTFALDGVTYEIDLTTANADKLRGLISPYTESGRRTGGRAARGRVGNSVQSSGRSGPDPAKVRNWAKVNGISVNDRGRVPSQVNEAFTAAANGDMKPLTDLQAKESNASQDPAETPALTPDDAAAEQAGVDADTTRRTAAVDKARKAAAPAKKAAATAPGRDRAVADNAGTSKRAGKKTAAPSK
jgi:hypothetical protein